MGYLPHKNYTIWEKFSQYNSIYRVNSFIESKLLRHRTIQILNYWDTFCISLHTYDLCAIKLSQKMFDVKFCLVYRIGYFYMFFLPKKQKDKQKENIGEKNQT